jgi:hypothetical protein
MAKGLQELIQRAVEDPDFRRKLLADPEEVVRIEGYEISSEKIEKIKEFSEAPPEAIDAIVQQVREGQPWAG